SSSSQRPASRIPSNNRNKRCRVEPSVHGSFTLLESNFASQIESIIGESYREARLLCIGSLNLPATDHGIGPLVDILSEVLPPTKWQLIEVTHGEAMRDILVRAHLRRPGIGGIQIFGRLEPLRERVR